MVQVPDIVTGNGGHVISRRIVSVSVLVALLYRFIINPAYYHLVFSMTGPNWSNWLGNRLIASMPDPTLDLPPYNEPMLVLNASNSTDMARFTAAELYYRRLPFTVKGAITNPTMTPIFDLLGRTVQNVYPLCAARPALVRGEARPCRNITLNERLDELNAARDADKSHAGAHPYMGRFGETENLYKLMFKTLRAPSLLKSMFNLWLAPPATTVIFAYGSETNVPHLHFHDDDFFAFNMAGKKKWTLIHPHFAPALRPVFTGTAAWVQTKALDASIPLLTAVVEPGDMLYVPAWYIHSTDIVGENAKISFAFSMHFREGPLMWLMSLSNEFGMLASVVDAIFSAITF